MIQSKVIFDEAKHTYTAPDGRKLSGVTPIISWMYPTTYAGISDEVLRAAAEYGTMVHKACEAADNGIVASDDFVSQYLELKKDNNLYTIANEYLVDDGRIASSIDVVAEGKDGIWLLDIKTTSSLHHENVRLQLSIYAYLAERFDIDAKRLAAVWIPRPQYGSPKLVEVSRIPSDICEEIITAYLDKDEEARERLLKAITTDTMPVEIRNAEVSVCHIIRNLKELEEQKKEIEARLLALMQEYNIKKYESENLVLTRVLPSKRVSIDTTRLKAEYPEIAKQLEKETTTKESIKITLR